VGAASSATRHVLSPSNMSKLSRIAVTTLAMTLVLIINADMVFLSGAGLLLMPRSTGRSRWRSPGSGTRLQPNLSAAATPWTRTQVGLPAPGE
jgi:hypothetical protein